MNYLYSILATVFVISLTLDYLSFYYKYSAKEIVNDMGIGYNLGNTYNYSEDLGNDSIENYEIKTWGTILPTKKMINKIKKNGFKTIRFQVKYANYTNEISIVNTEWISKIKEIVKWIINSNMYCILSIYHDNNYWELEGNNSKDKYINLWTQISYEFKDFDQHLIFESFYEFGFIFYLNFYEHFFNEDLFISQIFINIIRNSSGNNKERLLIVPGLSSELELLNFNFEFYEISIPEDPSNKLAISLNYYFPGNDFSEDESGNEDPIILYNNLGIDYWLFSNNNWGRDSDYKKLLSYFSILKKIISDKGCQIVIGEIGIFNKNVKKTSIRQFLYSIFSISSDNEGILPCLWDISEKIGGDMNYYYNKEINDWTDKVIGENFLKISKGNYIKISNYYYKSNKETEYINEYGYIHIDIGFKKVTTIILNIKILDNYSSEDDISFGLLTCQKNQDYYEIECINGKRQYDGSLTYTIDATKIECYYYIQALTWWSNKSAVLNYLTVIYEDYYYFLDYKSYKSAILNEINKN